MQESSRKKANSMREYKEWEYQFMKKYYQKKYKKPKFKAGTFVTIAVLAFVLVCGGLAGCGAKKSEDTGKDVNAGPEAAKTETETIVEKAAEPKATDFVWKVEPTLEYKKVQYCFCGFFGTEVPDGKGIDPRTGLIDNSEHYGHGGGMTNYLYDEGKNLFGYYSCDEGGEYFEMLSGNDFLSNVWRAQSLKAFQKIDSDKVTKYKNEWDGESFDLSNANVSEKYAVAYGTAFVSDFIYDYGDGNTGWNFSNDNAANIIALVLDGKWGIIDKDGNVVIPFCFEDIVLINEKTAFAKINGKYGILNVFGEPLDEDDIYPYGGEVFVTNFSDKNIFIRSEPVVKGESSKMNDGNKIGWIKKGDESVELVATGNEYHEGGNGHWWYEIEIPQWYRDTSEQAKNFTGKPLVGWVRDDIVRQVR